MSTTLYPNPDLKLADDVASLDRLILAMGELADDDFNAEDALEHLDWEREQAVRDCDNCGFVLIDRVECTYCGEHVHD